ncbi:hypothetical protein T09_4502 [Trichinella sp. T9]|nr:hypothetical protein T09_4502 [Trichinella sp. T9]
MSLPYSFTKSSVFWKLRFDFGHFEACGSSRSWIGTTQQAKQNNCSCGQFATC